MNVNQVIPFEMAAEEMESQSLQMLASSFKFFRLHQTELAPRWQMNLNIDKYRAKDLGKNDLYQIWNEELQLRKDILEPLLMAV